MAETGSEAEATENGNGGGDETGGGGGGEEVTQRPDWAPKDFWDGEKGELKVEDLAKAHTELGQRFAKGKKAFEDSVKDDVRAALADEMKPEIEKSIRAEISAKAPKSPNDYTVEVADDSPMKEALDKAGLVLLTEQPGDDFVREDGKEYMVVDGTHPLLPVARKVAHEAGYDNDQFVGLLMEYAAAEISMRPTQEALDAVMAKTYEALGEHGKDRVDYARGRLVGIVGEEGAALMWPQDATPSAKGVEAIERLLEKAGEPGFNAGVHAVGAKSADELLGEAAKLQESQEYFNGDKKTRDRVNAIYQRVYGSDAA